MQGPAAG